MLITPLAVSRLSLLSRANFPVAKSIFGSTFNLKWSNKNTTTGLQTTNGVSLLKVSPRTHNKWHKTSKVIQTISFASLLPFIYYSQNDESTLSINSRTIYNETAAYKVNVDTLSQQVSESLPTHKRERRKAMYKQLTVGSILGIVCGLLMIKVSVVLIYLTVFGMLGLQWLQSRNLITVNEKELFGLSKSVVTKYFKQGTETLASNDQYNYFKGSFLISLVLTYLNS